MGLQETRRLRDSMLRFGSIKLGKTGVRCCGATGWPDCGIIHVAYLIIKQPDKRRHLKWRCLALVPVGEADDRPDSCRSRQHQTIPDEPHEDVGAQTRNTQPILTPPPSPPPPWALQAPSLMITRAASSGRPESQLGPPRLTM